MEKIELNKKSNLELIQFIKNKTDKLCWEKLDIATDILEERFEKIELRITCVECIEVMKETSRYSTKTSNIKIIFFECPKCKIKISIKMEI